MRGEFHGQRGGELPGDLMNLRLGYMGLPKRVDGNGNNLG